MNRRNQIVMVSVFLGVLVVAAVYLFRVELFCINEPGRYLACPQWMRMFIYP